MSAVSAILDPRKEQRLAADPAASVWVSASAGTGKTSVLTDRVLSLLLAGTPPTRILCLTFTKAAAAEMANRIASRLGAWASGPDAALDAMLGDLPQATPKADRHARARRLFAQVVDAPGGLKIMTIHAFCQSLLRRFPLEAGLSPHFDVMDERSAAELMARARDEVLARAQPRDDATLARALAEVTSHVAEDEFGELMGDLVRERGRLARGLDRVGGVEGAVSAVYRRLGLDASDTPDKIKAHACADDAFDVAGLRAAAKALAAGSPADRDRGAKLAAWLAAPERRASGFADYLLIFLTAKRTIRATLATKAACDAAPHVDEILRGEAERLLDAVDRLNAATTAAATAALLRIGAAMLDAYERYKEFATLLDYDDLIFKTRQLLEARGAEWVLYKLDQGLDHILIDEAQDTNPDQWSIVAALAEEFFAGEGAKPDTRTVFAVGDAKQSIYSFQRADPKAFDAMRALFAGRVKAAAGTWRSVELEVSFRSAPAILQAVDAVFSTATASDGVVAPGSAIRHRAFREGSAGLVELWPAVTPRERPDFEPWSLPVTRESADSPPARLAAFIAARIKRWIERKEKLESKDRPIEAGDIMVLVRRRGVFVEELVRALKTANVAVAGVDRMVLTEQLAVMDLMALARFLLLPEDDLTLASVLKSPLVGLDEGQLFELAYGRTPRTLWQSLARKASDDLAFAEAHTYLSALLKKVDFIPPYELFAEVLGNPGRPSGPSGRERILARLGPEAEEPIDEFLAQSLLYERGHVPSLEGFLHWIEAGQGEIKRDPESSARAEVRIMTVHGAKGLQAPIVILPDTTQVPIQSPKLLWDEGYENLFLWPPRRAHEGSVPSALRHVADERRDQEYHRLLYVAMTRAEDRLYVCGWCGTERPAAGSWHNLVAAGLERIAEPFDFDCAGEIAESWSGQGLRLLSKQTAPPEVSKHEAAVPETDEVAPSWLRRMPPSEPVPGRPLAPSRPAEVAPSVRSPLGPDDGWRFRRGTLVHRLLEALPNLPPEAREVAAEQYLARPAHGLAEAERIEIARQTLAVLADPAFAPLFGPGSRAEVPIVGTVASQSGTNVISGQVDRLLVTSEDVVVLDYKTNRPPPTSVEDVAVVYLKQMAAYRALLREIYPARQVRCALLWTDGPRLMPLPDAALDPYAP
jgi:ATP-dependent helicase/nuclease subunit A